MGSARPVVPLAVEDTHRAIWALELRVTDGGADEDADTEGDKRR